VALLTEAELDAIRKHAEADYPAEACGVLLVRPGAVEERRLRACRNIQDELHAKDPGRFPRTARTAYYIAHEDLLDIGRREGEGFEVRVIYHSHVDAGAYFSETDRRARQAVLLEVYGLQKTLVAARTAARQESDARRGQSSRLQPSQAELTTELTAATALSRAIEGYSGLPTADQRRQIGWLFDETWFFDIDFAGKGGGVSSFADRCP